MTDFTTPPAWPRMVPIRQRLEGPRVEDIPATVRKELQKVDLASMVKPGQQIAIAVGSRGVANIALIVRTTVEELRSHGAEAIIVPTMGSHGGATAEGQRQVLESLGVTEEFCQAPIVSSMEVEQIGQTPSGMPVYTDKNAWRADGIILTGRIKLHTDFKSPHGYESGLMKMAAIGLGKHAQALALHSLGVHGICDIMPEVAKVVLEKAKVLCGIGIVENARDETGHIEALLPREIPVREPELLKLSTSWMPHLPVEDIDILIVDEMGKNHSGTGMDTNIIGRMRIPGVPEPASPSIGYIVVSSLSEASHGNGLGVGLADLTTRRLYEALDLRVMNENVVTSTFLQRGMIPLVMDHDFAAITAALRACWGKEPQDVRIVRIANTLNLSQLEVSESLLPELSKVANVEVAGSATPMSFESTGYLTALGHS